VDGFGAGDRGIAVVALGEASNFVEVRRFSFVALGALEECGVIGKVAGVGMNSLEEVVWCRGLLLTEEVGEVLECGVLANGVGGNVLGGATAVAFGQASGFG
jgi:hypothetical protein